MRLLLDTHAFLWFLLDDPQLSATARAVIVDPLNEVEISPASYWEIAIKIGLRKYALRFIRGKRAPGLKEVDMLIPIGVAFNGSKPGGQHVHQPVVSRLRHPRLPVPAHRPARRPDHLHHPPGTSDLPLRGLWFE